MTLRNMSSIELHPKMVRMIVRLLIVI